MKLINSAGKEVKIGDAVTSFRGAKAIVTGFTEPQHAGSTGRIHVKVGEDNRSYFPSVYDCQWLG